VGTYAEEMFRDAMILAGSGRFASLSEVQAELSTKYPNAQFLMFDEKYSHKLVYVRELLHKHGRKRS
jgi:hypothetical protein